MVVLVFGNVVLRYAFNSGITVSEELSRWLMVWLTFLGAIVALREHAHLGVDTLVRTLPPTGKRICFVLSYGLMLYADWLLLAGSWRQTIITAGDRAPATNLSVGLFYGAGIVFGLSAALHGEITLKDGRTEQSNFHDYPALRLAEMPNIEVHIVPSTDKMGGCGEPGTPPIAPAVANAVFAATGKRLRQLPLRLA